MRRFASAIAFAAAVWPVAPAQPADGCGDFSLLVRRHTFTDEYSEAADVALRDFDGDGHLDALVVNGAIVVLMSNGDGTFRRTACDVGIQAGSVVLADLDGDLDADAIITNGQGGRGDLFIQRNVGMGRFTTPEQLREAPNGGRFQLGDLDGDGDLDLARHQHNDLEVFVNDGGGSFTPGTSVPLEEGVISLTSGDYDGDGDIDLVQAGSQAVWIIRGRGDGTLDPPEVLFDKRVISVASSDVNGDDTLDLIMLDLFYSGRVTVALNDGHGAFSPMKPFRSGYIPGIPDIVALADLNGDTYSDVITMAAVRRAVSVHLNLGDGTYGRERIYEVGWRATGFDVGDLDNDGDVDLISADGDEITMLYNLGGGSFDYRVPVGSGPTALAAGDLDGDLDLDLVVTDARSDEVSILINDGRRSFTLGNTLLIGDHPAGVAVVDLDGDDQPDLAVASSFSDEVSVALNAGDGVFRPAVRYPVGDHPSGLVSGDLDGDGDVDVIVTNHSSNDLSILLNEGHGVLASELRVATGVGPEGLAIGDVDGDFDLDLAVAITAGFVAVHLGVGDGTFERHVAYHLGGRPDALVMTDLDGDGSLDLAVTRPAGGAVALLTNDGSGVFAVGEPMFSPFMYPTGIGAAVLGLGPLPDLILLASSDHVRVFRNDGQGGLMHRASMRVAATPRALVTVDLDNDFDFDLAVVGQEGDEVSLLYNMCHRCGTDLDRSGGVGFADLLSILASWGMCAMPCPTDLDGSGDVSFPDLVAVIANWGLCEPELVTGACAMEDGHCEVVVEEDCLCVGGEFLGVDAECPRPYSMGACCLVDGPCYVIAARTCALLDAVFLGHETTCDDGDCP